MVFDKQLMKNPKSIKRNGKQILGKWKKKFARQ